MFEVSDSPESGSVSMVNIKPLTRRNKAGRLYERLPDVEQQIASALSLAQSDLIARLKVKDAESSSYLKEECLVYLLREFTVRGNNYDSDEIAIALADRCTRYVAQHARKFIPDYMIEECIQDIVSDVFAQILNVEENSQGEFSQVRFWSFLSRIAIHHSYRYKTRMGYDFRTLHFRAEEEKFDGENMNQSISDIEDTFAALTSDDLIDLKKGLCVLNEPVRTAFILCHYEGWQIESNDPHLPTISKHFGKTPRTIRNWLMSAENSLREWRGGY